MLPLVSDCTDRPAALTVPPLTTACVRWPIRLTDAEPMPENLPLVAPTPADTPTMSAWLRAATLTPPVAVMLPLSSAL